MGTAIACRWIGLTSVLLLLGLFENPLLAQPAPSPSQPVPIGPISPPPPGQIVVVPATPPGPPPSPLTFTPIAPPSPLPVTGDPGPDGWGVLGPPSAPPGWFVDTQVLMAFPVLKFKIGNDTGLPQTGTLLDVPTVKLNSTVSPTFEIGYRCADSAGLVALAYEFLISEGTGQQVVDSQTYQVRTQVNLHAWRLDYGAGPYEFAPHWDLQYRVGVKGATLSFESQADSALETQMASNSFWGVGPHARLDVLRRIRPLPGLALFGRADGAVLIGEISQQYQLILPPGGTVLVDASGVRRSQAVTTLQLQAGVSYSPAGLPGLTLSTGYEFQSYFNPGRLAVDPSTSEISRSRGDLYFHGVFLRGRYDF